MDSMKRMKELIPLLTQASRAYYQEDREMMSNYEYDKLYDELVKLEAETGITLAGSPTTMRLWKNYQKKLMKSLCCRWIRRRMWRH